MPGSAAPRAFLLKYPAEVMACCGAGVRDDAVLCGRQGAAVGKGQKKSAEMPRRGF